MGLGVAVRDNGGLLQVAVVGYMRGRWNPAIAEY